MRDDVLKTVNEQFDRYQKIFHFAHAHHLITDSEMIQYLNEVSALKEHLITTINRGEGVFQ